MFTALKQKKWRIKLKNWTKGKNIRKLIKIKTELFYRKRFSMNLFENEEVQEKIKFVF